ncbi:MAG: Inosine-5'-monophosphate dehydrogenase [Candidatus Syntrophoarchaeum sp. GoM_oil]|nr:MAG: Inosine-5'-monophosphate dehydrogenase [Candidatus Syntrophoarchaeum sp. GoM_oil]
MNVKDVMSTPIITEDGDTTVNHAAGILDVMGVGSLVVTEEGVPVGIVTERDMALKVLSKNRSAGEVKLNEIMASPLITINADVSIDDAGKLMAEKKIRRLLVIDDGEIIGIVTVRDLLTRKPELVKRIYPTVSAPASPYRLAGVENGLRSCIYALKTESDEAASEKCRTILGKVEEELGGLVAYYEKDEELKDILTKVEKISKDVKEKGTVAITESKKEIDALLTDLRHIIRWRKISPSTTLGGQLPYRSRRSRL